MLAIHVFLFNGSMEIRIYGFFSGFTFPCRKNGRRHLGISVPIHSSRKLSPITRASLSGYDTLIHRTPGKRKKTDRSANLHIGPRIRSERYPLSFRIGNRRSRIIQTHEAPCRSKFQSSDERSPDPRDECVRTGLCTEKCRPRMCTATNSFEKVRFKNQALP